MTCYTPGLMSHVTIIGAGLAGTECAWQLAEQGVDVTLIEQKPERRTPAQSQDYLAELVCSNSLRGAAMTNAVGLLKHEMRELGSLIIQSADTHAVPAGGALAVDRDRFSTEITERIDAHPRITRVAQCVEKIPDARPLVIATGPLTGDGLAADLQQHVGEHLAYYDAIAPVVLADSIDFDKVFRASRYGKGDGDDYLNCPMDETTYHAFIQAILDAEKVQPKAFEKAKYFEGCLPIEVMAERGVETLAHGGMKPVGLVDPRTGEQSHAVVQLRQENAEATHYNLVGFQTRMTWPEQKRVFRMIPGLENVEFARLGTVHRNTFVNGPEVLQSWLELKNAPGVHLAGQISGVEGYVESAACGLVLGRLLAAQHATDVVFEIPPEDTALGALVRYVHTPRKDFQPSNVLWSMFPPLEKPVRGPRKGRKLRRQEKRSEQAQQSFWAWKDNGYRVPEPASVEPVQEPQEVTRAP